MYREPKSAKRLYFDVIPRHVDDYHNFSKVFRAGSEGNSWPIRSGTSTRTSAVADMP